MDDDCTECKLERLKIQDVPNCTIKNIKKICKKLPECNNINEFQTLLLENDTILYVTIYLALCWFAIQPCRKILKI